MKTIFWDISPCNLAEINRRFWRVYRLHHQGKTPDDESNVPEDHVYI
jgi:hypothetical protein